MTPRSGVERPGPTPFVQKVYELVQDPSTQDIVGWEAGGTSFIIHRTGEFVEQVLPLYFKHNNLSSFVRQLNQYSFHKVSHYRWEFEHASFRRDRPDLLDNIRRSKQERSRHDSSRRKDSAGPHGRRAGGDGQSGPNAPHAAPGASASGYYSRGGAAPEPTDTKPNRGSTTPPERPHQRPRPQLRSAGGGSRTGQQRRHHHHHDDDGGGGGGVSTRPSASGGHRAAALAGIEVGNFGALDDETAQLRRDNRLLLQELAQLRKMYVRLESRLHDSESREDETSEQIQQLRAFLYRTFSSIEILNSQLAGAGLDFLAIDPQWTQALPYFAGDKRPETGLDGGAATSSSGSTNDGSGFGEFGMGGDGDDNGGGGGGGAGGSSMELDGEMAAASGSASPQSPHRYQRRASSLPQRYDGDDVTKPAFNEALGDVMTPFFAGAGPYNESPAPYMSPDMYGGGGGTTMPSSISAASPFDPSPLSAAAVSTPSKAMPGATAAAPTRAAALSTQPRHEDRHDDTGSSSSRSSDNNSGEQSSGDAVIADDSESAQGAGAPRSEKMASNAYGAVQRGGSTDYELDTLQEKLRRMYQQERMQQAQHAAFLRRQRQQQQPRESRPVDADHRDDEMGGVAPSSGSAHDASTRNSDGSIIPAAARTSDAHVLSDSGDRASERHE